MKNTTTTFFRAVLLSLIVATSTMGQGHFSLAATVTPGVQNRDFVLDSGGGVTGTGSYKSISAGLTAHYAFTSKWSLSVGLLYNRSSGDSRFTNIIETTTYTHTEQNFQMPVLLNYASSYRRLSPYFSAGLLTSYNYRQKIGDANALNAYAMIGIGAQYRITPKLALIVQPTAAYLLTKPSNDYPLSYSRFDDYLFGLQTQLKFTF